MKTLQVKFYRSEKGNEPVREWLKSLSKENKSILGEDIKTIEYGWPLGMPLVRKMDKDLWEVRSDLTNKEIARVLFTVSGNNMVLLHGFIKKTQQTPINDLKIAKNRRDQILKG
ncbi:type II toxin-antitoxin system RelE/ParE family toxin [Legionella fairfieldensis]|uniref:type II toxin-antitoxin system RelE/ParE family toxin n=1 Tax=Legionella fairfieldensis TaxID=45064 RepID=UPI00048EB852|nr:type II toxin-antitoxin system RelE/ParE family toxin [Legionella fairfieldensis]